MDNKVTAIVLAAGKGSRMNSDIPKQYLTLLGKPVLFYSLQAFEKSNVDEVVLVTGSKEQEYCKKEIIEKYQLNKVMHIVEGGSERYHSVYNGLLAAKDADYVLIHDGARCLVNEETIRRCMNAVEESGNGVAAVPAIDTIKQVDCCEIVAATPDRSKLRAVQTPQGFNVELIRRAHEAARADDFLGTDDASLVERLGVPVRLTRGDRRNIKLTTPEDMKMAEAFLERDFPTLRVGQGYDVHRLVEGRDLILCGVKVPHTLGLLGHSDADVALHALMDAMLGAMALGDIGKHFPDTDEKYRGISSMTLLEHVTCLLHQHRARVANCDVTIVAQKPKLLPYIPAMRENIAAVLQLPLDRVNVKATTTERLSFEGHEEGISAQAICLVEQR